MCAYDIRSVACRAANTVPPHRGDQFYGAGGGIPACRALAPVSMDRITHLLAARLVLTLLAMIGLWLSFSCESIVEYYRVMRIDPETLKVSLSDSIWFGEIRDIQGEYYESRINVSTEPHRRTISHYEKLEKSIPVMLDIGMIDADRKLIYREKRQVLARQPEVTILAKTLYGYADLYRHVPPDVLVHAETDLGWERPQEEEVIAMSQPPRINGAALVRVLKQADGSVAVGSANYGIDGRMKALDTRSLHSGRIDNSTVAIQVNGQTFGNGTSLLDEQAKRGAFGFPERFQTSEYMREPRWPALPNAPPSVTDLVIIEYNINEWMRVDQYGSSKLGSTRILHFKELPEDRMLAPIDRRGLKDSRH
jgi:hypothetical protein